MKRLFLTSSTHQVSKHWVQHIDLDKENKLAFITTPADGEIGDKQWLADDRTSLINVGFTVTDYTIVGKNSQELLTELAAFDILYVSGGNTFYMLQQSHISGFFEAVHTLVEERGKVYVGTSAGSIIAGPRLPEYLLNLGEQLIEKKFVDGTGFGFVNFILLPHWGSESFKSRYLESRINRLYSSSQYPILLLTDFQYVQVEGDSVKIIDTSRL